MHKTILFIILLLLLSNCSFQSEEQEISLPIPSATPGSSLAADTLLTTPGTQTTITLALAEIMQSVYAPIVKRFSAEHPEIRVQFVTSTGMFPEGIDPDRGQAQLADVSIGFVSSSYAAKHRGPVWLDLRPFMDGDASFDRNDFYTGTLEAVSDASHTYAVPLSRTFNLMVYNKDVWEAANLPPPAQDWTWNELRAAAAQIAQRAPKNRKVYGWLNAENYYEALIAGLQAQGIDALSTPVDALRIDDPRYIQIIEQIAQLEQSSGIYTPPLANDGTNFSAIDTAISSHQVALFSSLWLRPDTKLRIGFAPSVLRGPRSEYPLRSFVISSGTRHPDAAWKLIAFLSKNEPGSPFPFHHGIMPARKSVAERLGYWQTRSPDEVAALQTMLNRPRIDPIQGDSLLATIRYAADVVRAIVDKQQPPQRAAAEAQRAFEQARAQIPKPTASAPPIVVNTPVPAAAETATRITFSAAGIDASAVEALVRQFQNKTPAIAVATTMRLGATDSPFLQMATTTDCFITPSIPATPAERAAVLDLAPLLDADTALHRADYPPALLAPLRNNGRLLGLPLRIDLPALTYLPTRFSDAGVPAPSAQTTLADMLALAPRLTDAAADQYTLALVGNQTNFIRDWLRAAGTPIARQEQNQWRVAFATSAVEQTTAQITTMLRTASPHQHLVGYSSTPDDDTSERRIASGKIALWSGNLAQAVPNATVIPFPVAAGQPRLQPRVALAGYVAAGRLHTDACWQWLRFLSEQPIIGGIPARRSVATSDVFLRQASPGTDALYRAYTEVLNQSPSDSHAPDPFNDPTFDPYWFYRAIDRALQGKNLERELAEAQTMTEAYLACTAGGGMGPQCATQVDATYAGLQAAAP